MKAFLQFLFMLMLLALVGYNTYEIAQLRAEIDRLQSPGHHVAITSSEKASASHRSPEPAGAESGVSPPRQRRWEDAGKEATEAIDALKKANSDAQAASQHTISDLQKRIADLSARVERLKPQGGLSLPHSNSGEQTTQ